MLSLQRISRSRKALTTTRTTRRTLEKCSFLQHASTNAPTHGAITTRTGQVIQRSTIDSLLRRRLFYTPSFEIYGGSSGFYDLGPPGSALQANLVQAWREHFIIQEDALEIDCPAITPEDVLRTSGHVDKFADWMCKDLRTNEVFRADHLIKEALQSRLNGLCDGTEQAPNPRQQVEQGQSNEHIIAEYEKTLVTLDQLDGPALGRLIEKYEIKSTSTGGELSSPTPFNLMFQTSIGLDGNAKGYLRPETAQGQFTNFAKLLEFNQKKMPFASASIGKAFRNEISPRSGLLRVREFLMAEIEHFIDPEGDKKHARFAEVEQIELEFLDRDSQLNGSSHTQNITVQTAVSRGLVHNETLGYFLARIHQFLVDVGIDPTKIRFRQHLPNEMAHYATDCWDAEILCTYGWIECVGCADRAAFDLTKHATKTGTLLSVLEARKAPKEIDEWEINIDMKSFGPRFRKDAKAVEAALKQLSQGQREELHKTLATKGRMAISVPSIGDGEVEIGADMVTVERRARLEHIREYIPSVIEPSFGIGRILYCLLEHAYWAREGAEERAVMSFPPTIAPTKTVILPLSNNSAFDELLHEVQRTLRQMKVSHRIDDSSASIGKRYTRNDELGTPLGITIDFQSLKDKSITLRDRDTTAQVRADVRTICDAIKTLTDGTKSWADISCNLPGFHGQEID